MCEQVAYDAQKKQGSYGKVRPPPAPPHPTTSAPIWASHFLTTVGQVQIHKSSKLEQLCHLDEVVAMLRYKLFSPLKSSNVMVTGSEAARFCDVMLGKVSRSFAGVIRQLPSALQLDICVFYLVLRALDTVEDDMSAFLAAPGDKITHLLNFYKYLEDPALQLAGVTIPWNDGVGDGDERYLVEVRRTQFKTTAAQLKYGDCSG